MKQHSRYLAVIAVAVAVLQIAFLASMIMSRAAILRDGREILLEVRPVDPRDLLRGDYVRVGYNISSVPVELVKEVTEETGQIINAPLYVRLEPGDDGIWKPVAARIGAPPPGDPGANQVDIRGTTLQSHLVDVPSVRVAYGIERFYLPEGEGKPIETDMRERSFRMAVAVDASGTAQIKAFYDGDNLIYSEPIY